MIIKLSTKQLLMYPKYVNSIKCFSKSVFKFPNPNFRFSELISSFKASISENESSNKVKLNEQSSSQNDSPNNSPKDSQNNNNPAGKDLFYCDQSLMIRFMFGMGALNTLYWSHYLASALLFKDSQDVIVQGCNKKIFHHFFNYHYYYYYYYY